MRPKRVVLLVDSDETAISLRRFFIETRGFRVCAASNVEQALEIISSMVVDMVAVTLELGKVDGNSVVIRLKELRPDLPMILTSKSVGMGERAHAADGFLGRSCNSNKELIERIRVMTSRKRGPKKAVVSISLEMMNAG